VYIYQTAYTNTDTTYIEILAAFTASIAKASSVVPISEFLITVSQFFNVKSYYSNAYVSFPVRNIKILLDL
jgi:hypothetical protein